MRARGLFAVIAVIAVFPACGTDQTVSGVFPAEGFLGRQVRVEISGDATTWSSGTSVDFGPGITVQQVSVASKTSLFADIVIAPTATPGLQDVVVHDGDSQVLRQAFEIRSPVDITVQGTAAQGSVIFYTIRNLDIAHPFDNTRDVNGDFSNIQFGLPPGTSVSINSVTEFQARVGILIDVDGQAGDLVMTSGIGDKALTSPLGRVEIQPRTPIALTSGVTVNKSQSEPFHSELYSFDPAAGPAAVLASVGGHAGTSIALLGPSGRFDNVISFSPTFFDILPTTGKLYAVVLDNSGDFDYAYGIKMQSSPTLVNDVVETAAVHDTGATAQAVTLPTIFEKATITCSTIDPKTQDCTPAATDKRVMAFTVAAGDIGKKVHIITTGMDKLTDVVVDVFTNAALTTSLGGPSPDTNVREDFTSAPIPQGTVVGSKIFIVVTPSVDFSPAHAGYDAAFWLE